MNATRLIVLASIAALALPVFAAGPAEPSAHAMHGDGSSSALIEKVRVVTAPFQSVTQATDAGYQAFLGCVSGPQEGAMGVHFVKGPLVFDGELDVNTPEALIYEPRTSGYRLVGVEYIVIAEGWHARHQDPPVLEGQVFHFNNSPNRFGLPPFYELHVWAARPNPNGAFADWNTHVTCEGQ